MRELAREYAANKRINDCMNILRELNILYGQMKLDHPLFMAEFYLE
jgi:hypothetical protein